jgi:hypothetical protein
MLWPSIVGGAPNEDGPIDYSQTMMWPSNDALPSRREAPSTATMVGLLQKTPCLLNECRVEFLRKQGQSALARKDDGGSDVEGGLEWTRAYSPADELVRRGRAQVADSIARLNASFSA